MDISCRLGRPLSSDGNRRLDGFTSENPERKHALALYAAQLAVNALWPILYFRLDAALAALAVLVLLWISFAFYLNLSVVLYLT